MATPVSTNSWILVVTGEPRMRHEVDSNFFELLTLSPPPPRPVALGEHTHQCKGGKKKGTQNTADGLPPCRGLVTYELLSF